MEAFFVDNGITVKTTFEGMSIIEKPSEEDIELTRVDIHQSYDQFTLPDDYIEFCKAHGGGTIGRAKVYVHWTKTIKHSFNDHDHPVSFLVGET